MSYLVTQGLGGLALVTGGLGDGAPGAVAAYVEDPWLAWGYNAAAEVEIDVNALGLFQTDHGGVVKDYRPVTGVGTLRMVLVREARSAETEAARPQNVVRWRAIYGRQVALDMRHRLVLDGDVDRPGRRRYLEVAAPSELVFQDRTAHRSVRLVERFGRPAT